MKSYVMMIAGGALLSAFADIMVPSEWKKYVRIITGFILLAVIMSPAARIKEINLFEEHFPTDKVEYTPMPQMVASELEKSISADAEERLRTQLGAGCEIDTRVRINGEGQIEAVEEMRVRTAYNDAEAVRRLISEVYGAEKVTVKNE